MSGRLVGLLAAILAALFSAPSPAATAVPEAVVVGYTYAGDHHVALSIDTVTERDPPVVAYDCTAPASAAYDPAVRVAHSDNASVTARTASHGNAGGIHVVPASRCAARTGTPGADDVLNGVRLRAQLTGQEISGGHAFEKHILDLGEFPGIRTRAQFAAHIEDMVLNGEMRTLGGGRTAFWRDGTVVIRNLRAPTEARPSSHEAATTTS